MAAATLDKLSGAVPLTVNIDMSGSTDPDGSISNYFFICGGGGFAPGSGNSKGSCTFTTPGAYWILLEVQDNTGYVDLISAYAVATPAGGGDTTPPSVAITSPASGASILGSIPVTANAADDSGGSGVNRVDFYLDFTTLLGTATSAPYEIIWDTSSVRGAHTLTAIATDHAGDTTTSGGVSITVKNFTLSALPGSNAVLRGTSAIYTATVSPLAGFNSSVELSVSGLPSGAIANFNPTSVTGSGNSTLTVNTGTAAAGGPYTLTIKGQSGTFSHATNVALTITAPDFSLSISPTSSSVNQGLSTTTRATIAPLNGFSGSVSFSVVAPAGLTTRFNPPTVTGSGSSTLTLTATDIAAGTYPLQVTGTSGALTHSAGFSLTVKLGGTLSLTANPTTITVSRSTNPYGWSSIKVTSSNGFRGSATLSASGLPNGATASFSPSTVSLSPGSPAATSTMTVTVRSNMNSGKPSFTVTAKSNGGPQAQSNLTLQVNK